MKTENKVVQKTVSLDELTYALRELGIIEAADEIVLVASRGYSWSKNDPNRLIVSVKSETAEWVKNR